MNKLYRILYENKIKLVYTPLIVYWITLFIATSLPSKALPKIAISDKFEHLFAYMILGILLYLTFKVQEKFSVLNKHGFIITVSVLAFYGLFDELHQMLIPGRYCETWDFIADVAGGIIGVIITYYVVFKEKKRVIQQQ